VIHAVAAAEDGTLELDIGGEFWENTLLKAGNAERKVSVPVVPLARLVEEMPESLTVLICDIEGGGTVFGFLGITGERGQDHHRIAS
jgi:hypothetical protein